MLALTLLNLIFMLLNDFWMKFLALIFLIRCCVVVILYLEPNIFIINVKNLFNFGCHGNSLEYGESEWPF